METNERIAVALEKLLERSERADRAQRFADREQFVLDLDRGKCVAMAQTGALMCLRCRNDIVPPGWQCRYCGAVR